MSRTTRFLGLTARQHQYAGLAMMFVGSLGFGPTARAIVWIGIVLCVLSYWIGDSQ